MRVFILILMIALLGVLQYQSRQHHTHLNPVSTRFLHPFDHRIRYRIADVDARFGLSQDEILKITQDAIKIWSDATGKEYFFYDPNARLALYFQYDDRQYETEQRKKHIQDIDQRQQQWANKKQQIDHFGQELDHNRVLLESRRQELENLIANYNQYIATINRLGGAELAQKQYLQYQANALEQQIQQMKVEISHYNFNTERLNQQVSELNQINQSIDLEVIQFNQRFQPRLFDKGSFNGKAIHIYEFATEDDLRLTLAHEFGHALGLKHHNTPNALMFPMMKDQDMQNFRLQAADLALLAERKN